MGVKDSERDVAEIAYETTEKNSENVFTGEETIPRKKRFIKHFRDINGEKLEQFPEFELCIENETSPPTESDVKGKLCGAPSYGRSTYILSSNVLLTHPCNFDL